MYFLKIGDDELPTPSYYTVNSDDINSTDSSRSDETGKMHRRRIRAAVKTVNVKWILCGAQAKELIGRLSAPRLEVTLLDTADMDYCSCEMFASELKSVFYQEQNDSENGSYWEISCRLTEY